MYQMFFVIREMFTEMWNAQAIGTLKLSTEFKGLRLFSGSTHFDSLFINYINLSFDTHQR